MLKFKKENNKVVLSYSSDQPSPEWVYHELDKSGSVSLGKAFIVTKSELISAFDKDDEHDPVKFEIALKKEAYYCFPKDILSLEHDLYVHEDVGLERKLFIAERGISIFSKIDKMVDCSIYVGGDNESAIPESIFRNLLKAFPNSYELNRYASARISSVLSSYIETKDDSHKKYRKDGGKGKRSAPRVCKIFQEIHRACVGNTRL